MLGRKVLKHFEDEGTGDIEQYRGTVTDVEKDDDGWYYTVEYDDGDAEELNIEELTEVLL